MGVAAYKRLQKKRSKILKELERLEECDNNNIKRIDIWIYQDDDDKLMKMIKYSDEILEDLYKKQEIFENEYDAYLSVTINHGIIERYNRIKDKDIKFIDENLKFYQMDFSDFYLIDSKFLINDYTKDKINFFKYLSDKDYSEVNARFYELFISQQEFNYKGLIDIHDKTTMDIFYYDIMIDVMNNIWNNLHNDIKLDLFDINEKLLHELFSNDKIIITMDSESSYESIIHNIVRYIGKNQECVVYEDPRLEISILRDEKVIYSKDIVPFDEKIVLEYLSEIQEFIKNSKIYKISIDINHGVKHRFEQLKNKNIEYIKKYYYYYYTDFDHYLSIKSTDDICKVLPVIRLEDIDFMDINTEVYKMLIIDDKFNYTDIVDISDDKSKESFSNLMINNINKIWKKLCYNSTIDVDDIKNQLYKEIHNNTNIKVF